MGDITQNKISLQSQDEKNRISKEMANFLSDHPLKLEYSDKKIGKFWCC